MPFTPTANFRHGHPLMVDYTPNAAVNAGDVVVVGVGCRIAHLDIPANVLGAVAMGYGVYSLPKTPGNGTAIAIGVKVYWDATNKVVTVTPTNNTFIGITVQATVDLDDRAAVLHLPA